MKILLVDNDPVYLNLLGEVLTLYSHQVFKAADGEAALAILQKELVHLIISDVGMPNINGMDLHIRIREDARLKSIPFAWNSAYPELLEVLQVEDPAIDFKFDKTMALPNLLYFVNRIDTSRRLRTDADPATERRPQ
jgi:CheY-like chemotaxis protein